MLLHYGAFCGPRSCRQPLPLHPRHCQPCPRRPPELPSCLLSSSGRGSLAGESPTLLPAGSPAELGSEGGWQPPRVRRSVHPTPNSAYEKGTARPTPGAVTAAAASHRHSPTIGTSTEILL